MEVLIKSEKKQKEFVHLVHDEYKKEDKNFFIFHIWRNKWYNES